MDYDKVKNRNIEYFSKLLHESDDVHQVVAQSKISHLKRFKKILELGDFQGKSLLDVGCGIGGFYGFLKERGITVDYLGVDINPQMIDKAKTCYFEIQDRFRVHDILEQPLARTFDYVIAIGPLNLKFPGSLNMEVTARLIRRMVELSNIGTAISMTSALTQKPHPGTFYYDPLAVLARVLPFCRNVKLDHTFLPHDFVLFCYRRDLYDF
jgi:SAM-dependent methyltransferase